MKKFNVDNAIQEIANHFKSEILKGNFTIGERHSCRYVMIGKYKLLIYFRFPEECLIIDSMFEDFIVFSEDEKSLLEVVFTEKQAELKELEKVNLAKEIAAKQRLLDSM